MAGAARYLALDLGAESGRAVAGGIEAGRLRVQEVHRFPNVPVHLPDGLHWDVLSLLREVRIGIAAAAALGPVASLGIDAWGVDFGLLDARGALLGNPFHYRDRRTAGLVAVACRMVSRDEIFAQTGIQFSEINSLYQLLAMVRGGDPLLDIAATFLTIPDLLAYWLTGRAACERTNASTTQCLDPRTGAWAYPLLERLGIPGRIFPEVVPPGAVLGPLRGEQRPLVVAPAAHDTGSAVAGTPLGGSNSAYISSGTWSLVGVEVPEPVITPRALELNLTNEAGMAGTFRLLRNVMGLWLLQGIRASLAGPGQAWGYDELVVAAERSRPLAAVIDPDDERFLRAPDMPEAIRGFCRETGQPEPGEPGDLARLALEGLALRYRWVVERLEEVSGRCIQVLHVVGGGARNGLLCRMT
ncbi:MAG: rhamnulokinase, partial [Chloroflexota bacterium]